MNRQRLAVTLAVGFVVLLGGVAFAYWRGLGMGTGSGTNSAAAPIALTPATPATSLYPGGLTDVGLTVTNPNRAPVRVASLALDTARGTGGFAVDAGHSGCAVSDLNFTTQNNGGGWTVPAREGLVDGMLSITLVNALAMGVGAQNACQGANITVYLVAGS